MLFKLTDFSHIIKISRLKPIWESLLCQLRHLQCTAYYSSPFISKYVNIADDLVRTMDLWYQKQLLCQLSHNHCPDQVIFFGVDGWGAITQRFRLRLQSCGPWFGSHAHHLPIYSLKFALYLFVTV